MVVFMTTRNGSVSDFLNRYWREGFNIGLLIADGIIVCLCAIDTLRFAAGGGSIGSAVQLTAAEALKGETVGLAIGVVMFLSIAIPMVMALFTAFLAPRGLWPKLLTKTPKNVLALHVFVGILIAVFTSVAINMQLLSGYAKDERGLRYNFGSLWLGAVFMGKPVYVAYISPIIRKFVIRFGADPSNAGHKLNDVIREVGTEESLGGNG
jgi:hypothetical protein